MRHKELRIALICYGGVSLAVYMHGVTKELWHLARASRAFHAGEGLESGTGGVYRALIEHIADDQKLAIRVLPDILTGASAGGINAVFLAQAIHSGQSLEPLTDLWLETADVERLLDPDAKPGSRADKVWAMPLVWWLLTRPGNAVSDSVAPETRAEVRQKLSRLVRARWFAPPFSGIGFSRLIAGALDRMAGAPAGPPLLPQGHPIDLFVTATDFKGYLELLHLNSPALVEESEHRLPISFRAKTPRGGGSNLAMRSELIFAARSTASFPGAFPPLQVAEIDQLGRWPGRDAFLRRVMPTHVRQGNLDGVSLIDGSVLVNAPFEGAMAALQGRPAQREVDRRFVYIDPHPDRAGASTRRDDRPVGFFSAIFGSLSTIPREQPIRDNLEQLAADSREAERLQRIVSALRPEIEQEVDRLFGRTLFLDRPTAKRLAAWRAKAQQAAAEKAGYAFHAYAQIKDNGIVERLARTIVEGAGGELLANPVQVAARLREQLGKAGLDRLAAPGGGATAGAIDHLRSHDVGFRIRRLRLLARRIARDWDDDPDITEADRDAGREAVYAALALYFERETVAQLGTDFPAIAAGVMHDPAPVLAAIAKRRDLPGIDARVEVMLEETLVAMPKALRRRMLLAYLGFPFYDVATLPLLRNEGLTEFDPVKVDRISPNDATAIREGGANDTLRGTEFYNFGAFFSRTYRENDYLWGRLHGAERMIDLVCSTTDTGVADAVAGDFKRRAFLAIVEEERERLTADPDLIDRVRAEIEARMAI